MKDFKLMELLQSTNSTYSDFPDRLLAELDRILLVLRYFLKQIAIVGEVHYDAQKLPLIEKSLLVADDAGVLY